MTTAMLSPTSSSPSSPPPASSPSPNSNTSMPSLVAGNPARRSMVGKRQSSLARDRISTYSVNSTASQKPSRPVSSIIPIMRSSLPYSQVRDFAYPQNTPLHYGPPPISSATPSGQSTPAFESQLGAHDLPDSTLDPARTSWTAGGWGGNETEQLPQVAYRGSRSDDHGPPYSEDEDLQSPVVVSSKHRRWPSELMDRSDDDDDSPDYNKEREFFTGINGDGSETYYVSQADEMADGPGGELVTYPLDHVNHSNSALYPGSHQKQHGDHRRLSPGHLVDDESRYSRDYQFTIASPDEEMHGKAVALFDFARENENELPLIEGQVIWVSYRHGQGWLVAEDPKTRESGLVPEEYVRLLRDIEGGWTSLSADGTPANPNSAATADDAATTSISKDSNPISQPAIETAAKSIATNVVTTSSADPGTPSSPLPQQQHPPHSSNESNGGGSGNGERRPPVVSTFSTSSKDLDHYPHPLLGTQTGQQPPQVIHYGSQSQGQSQSTANTNTNAPTVLSPNVMKTSSTTKVSSSPSASDAAGSGSGSGPAGKAARSPGAGKDVRRSSSKQQKKGVEGTKENSRKR